MKDLFSGVAADYARYRPGYPKELFEFIFQHVKHFDNAWDCATGNGQAAEALATKFKHVFATDISSNQLQQSKSKSNITYLVTPAEKTSFKDHTFDLVTVAQALHWFDFDLFYTELRRVLKPEGIFAAWSYGLARVSPEVDRIVKNLYQNILSDYWDERRLLIDKKYRTIPFPLTKIQTPNFSIELEWALDHFINYIFKTWSGVQSYIQKTNQNPLDLVRTDLENAWGPPSKRTIKWPIYLLMGTQTS